MWKFMIKKYWSSKFYRIRNTGLTKQEGTEYLVILVLELFFQRPTFSILHPGDDRDGGPEANMTDNIPSEIPHFFGLRISLELKYY